MFIPRVMTKIFASTHWLLPATVLLLLSTDYSVALGRSQPQQVAATPSDTIRFNASDLPTPPSGGREPPGRGSGGRRGCNDTNANQLIPLVPMTEAKQTSVRWGLTTATHPTLWLHTGTEFEQGALVVLSMRDRANKPVYRVQFQVPQTPAGVVRLAVPTTVAALQTDQPYYWQLSVFCNSGNGSLAEATFDTPLSFKGSIQRIPPSAKLQTALAQAHTPLAKAIALAENGIWYDALTTLGNQTWEAQAASPEITQAWADLLRQVNLGKTAAAPIVNCCQPQ